ncbi:hypothetical protein K491DRAFT_358882 [Lophiostoma macrostomum CBS 122681]|uniref:Uncharacterized protein n=1 Tax=Lophiostoma macrostomum CBS 122681 TaxID=1314788 RepID=A0A6A6TAL2_9PLEO|nr:hypothetical protein K491DRAFT_358882 [Lophiostoma macrostomum CBS 122681]
MTRLICVPRMVIHHVHHVHHVGRIACCAYEHEFGHDSSLVPSSEVLLWNGEHEKIMMSR